MSTINTTRRIVSAFAESGEEWKQEHGKVKLCLELEDCIKLGIYLFRHLTDLEARLQAKAIEGELSPDSSLWEDFEETYRTWLRGAEKHLTDTKVLTSEGYDVERLAEFVKVIDECKCMLANNAMESEIRPLDELAALAKPDNPRPGRYGDID